MGATKVIAEGEGEETKTEGEKGKEEGGGEKEKKYCPTYIPFHFVINRVLIHFFSLSPSLPPFSL